MKKTLSAQVAVGALALALLSGCASTPAASTTDTAAASGATETDSPQARLAITYDGGVQVLDAATLQVLADIELDEPARISSAGDGRHVALSAEAGIGMLDTGAWTDAHGDHGHSYTADPRLTDIAFEMSTPGHVVPHGEKTALFSDGDGTVTIFDSHELAEGQPEVETVELRAPHHGVAVLLEDGTLVVTDGDDEERRSIVALDDSREEFRRTDECPDVHGEATAADERVVFGCSGGVVVWMGDDFATVPAPDAEASIGTARGSDESSVVLTNYAVEGSPEDADGPRRIALVDTSLADGSEAAMSVVTLPAGYASSTLARGPEGEGLVLGTDGVLRVLSEESGSITGELPLIDQWEVPEDYRSPRPTVTVLDDVAWITDPATSTVHVVDLDDLEVVTEAELDIVPNQLIAVTG
ncbi:hypothetical protein ACFUTX_15865 [Microbacterium sp. NPDC057407]|uniref:hypothetical protein n=1 Tax=Microbacterium sp. NPDC057407 TaxID=3346120 RepID=UPI00366CCF66